MTTVNPRQGRGQRHRPGAPEGLRARRPGVAAVHRPVGRGPGVGQAHVDKPDRGISSPGDRANVSSSLSLCFPNWTWDRKGGESESVTPGQSVLRPGRQSTGAKG